MVMTLLLVVLLTASTCAARDFYVGGRDGWTTNPGEPHNHWAERNRFQVNDTLVFRYNKDVDAVLWVSQSHYDACNTTEPFRRLDGGDSRFVFDHSGPYFFISADAGRCRAGERLIVVVLAVRNSNIPSPLLPSSPPPSPPTSASQPSASPPKPSSSAPPPPPPPVPSPAPRALPPPPQPSPSAENVSSPSPAPWTAPVPGTNGTCAPSAPSMSSAVAMRAGVLACLLVAGGAAIL